MRHGFDGGEWVSRCWWPEGSLPSISDYSEDYHATYRSAEAVCRMLERDGFGGNGELYPARTAVEQRTDEAPVRVINGKQYRTRPQTAEEALSGGCIGCVGYGTDELCDQLGACTLVSGVYEEVKGAI